MMDYKIILGYLAASLQVLSYLVYFYGIYKGKTKPHAFTWFVWGVINIVAFAAILTAGGGPGAWIVGVNMVLCLVVAYIGYRQKMVQYDLFDWLALTGGIIGAILWGLTKNPLSAVVLVTLSDAIGMIPTFRKAHRLPFEENATSFAMGILNYIIALFALRTLNLTTWLYPAQIILTDSALVILILFRRKQMQKKTPTLIGRSSDSRPGGTSE